MPLARPLPRSDIGENGASLTTDTAHHGSPLNQSNKSGESSLRVVRQTELVGGQLSATLTREHLLLTAEFLKGQECVVRGLDGRGLTAQH